MAGSLIKTSGSGQPLLPRRLKRQNFLESKRMLRLAGAIGKSLWNYVVSYDRMSWTRIWPYRYTRTASNGQPVSSTTPRARAQTSWPWSTAPFNKYTHESLKLKPHIHFSLNDWFFIKKCSFRSLFLLDFCFRVSDVLGIFFIFLKYFFAFLLVRNVRFADVLERPCAVPIPSVPASFTCPVRPPRTAIFDQTKVRSSVGSTIRRWGRKFSGRWKICASFAAIYRPMRCRTARWRTCCAATPVDVICTMVGNFLLRVLPPWNSSTLFFFVTVDFKTENTSVLPFIQNIFSIQKFLQMIIFQAFFPVFWKVVLFQFLFTPKWCTYVLFFQFSFKKWFLLLISRIHGKNSCFGVSFDTFLRFLLETNHFFQIDFLFFLNFF